MPDAFAIVGMECVLPGALSADAWIEASKAAKQAIGPGQPGRWPMDPASVRGKLGDPDRTPTDRGGFVDGFTWDPRGLDVPDGLDPLFHWVLHVVRGVVGTERA